MSTKCARYATHVMTFTLVLAFAVVPVSEQVISSLSADDVRAHCVR